MRINRFFMHRVLYRMPVVVNEIVRCVREKRALRNNRIKHYTARKQLFCLFQILSRLDIQTAPDKGSLIYTDLSEIKCKYLTICIHLQNIRHLAHKNVTH